MNNAIVYSFHFETGNVKHSSHYGQLLYSISCIRKYNKTIPIKVCVSPPGILDDAEIKLEGVEVIEFDAPHNNFMDDKILSRRKDHRWINAYKVLEDGGYDHVLYVDQDTIFQGNVESIFKKYANKDTVCAKQDYWEEFTDHLPLTTRPMNDGITLFSKKTLEFKDDLLLNVDLTILKWQEMYRGKISDFLWTTGIQWASCQYATSEYLGNVGLPFIKFDPLDVSIIYEYRDMNEYDKSQTVALHYLSSNYEEFVPEEFLTYMEK